MNAVDFKKYKVWLESQNYVVEKIEKYPSPMSFNRYIFTNGTPDKYYVIVFTKYNGLVETDYVASISHGPGTMWEGKIKNVKMDFRKKFWKNMELKS